MFLFMKNKEIIQIRLLVIEDNAALVKAGLRNFFRTGRDKIHVSHITENVEQAINEINVLDFDVILLDLFIPGTSPVHNMGLLKQKFPGKPVVIYSSMNSKIWRRRMWDLGANGYVHKNDDRDTLKTAIEDAFEGKVVFSPSEGQSNLIHRGLRTIPEHSLSFVDKEILSMLADGKKYKEIAASLNQTETAIDSIVRNLRDKFNAHSTPQLIYLLAEQGLM